MSNFLKTKKGTEEFKVVVEIAGANIAKVKNTLTAFVDGNAVPGIVKQAFVGKKEIELDSLTAGLDPKELIGKDPTKMTPDEIAALQTYLAELAKGNAGVSNEDEAEEEVTKAAEKKAGKKAEKKEETEKPALPKGVTSIDDLEGMKAKEVWAIAKPIADELDGINSRSKKDEMIEALAEYYGLEATESDEEDEELEEDDVDAAFEDDEEEDDTEYEEDESEDDDEYEDDEEEDDEDSDDEEDEDEEDDSDEDEDDDDEDEEEDDDDESDEDEDEEEDGEWDEDEDEEDDENDVTEEDVDALFESGNKKAIIKFCKEHGISLPKKKLSAAKVKAIIKEALFGDE